MAAPSYGEVNKRLKDAMMSKIAPDAEDGGEEPQAAPELSADDKVAAAVGAQAMQSAAPTKEEGPSTLAQLGTGLASTVLGLLPQTAAYATGGSEALEKQRQVEKETAARQDEINKRAAELASQAKKLELEQKKANSEEEYKRQKLEIDRMNAETQRQKSLADQKKEKEPKEAQFNAAGFTKRMEQAEADLNKVTEKGFDPTSKKNWFTGWAPESLKSEGRKSFEQARSNFINAVLRRESGAAISASEFDSANKQYFPVEGDTPDVLAQKAQNRALAVATMKAASGPAYEKVNAGVPAAMIASHQNPLVQTAQAAEPQKMSPDAVMKAAGINQKQLEKYAKDNNVSVEKALSVLERRLNGKK